jgi:enoyl-CoA hydratase/carnithine racemase
VSTVRSSVEDGIGRITLDRPAQMNAVTVDLGRELEAAIRDLGSRDVVSVIAVRGAGGNFCAGGDFDEVERLRAGGPEALAPLFDNFRRACDAVAEVDQPVVAVVEGVAMAGGFEFLQAADVVLVREDARLSDNHVNFGQVPGGGGSQRLARLVGRQRALGHLLSGERLSGADAVAIGLAHKAYPAETFDVDVETFLQRMAGRRRDALIGIKSLVRQGLEVDLAEGLELERTRVLTHISGEAGGAGVSSFAGSKGERP